MEKTKTSYISAGLPKKIIMIFKIIFRNSTVRSETVFFYTKRCVFFSLGLEKIFKAAELTSGIIYYDSIQLRATNV